jgi:tRNA (cytidine/uridine-2'-O-)-methyltransferase|tara:strand:+ start:16 stop:474 length:459 start_codon:yes stop_codon:yes gene_type:complete
MTHKFEICLYQPDMPQNIAVAIRTSACLGFPLHIVNPLSFSFTDKRFRGAVMDYMQHCELIRHENWEDFINFSLAHKSRVIIATTKTSKSFYDFEFKKKDIVIFGKETAGLPKKIHDQINLQITIPMKKNTRSLNLATSVAIIATEISRQLI